MKKLNINNKAAKISTMILTILLVVLYSIITFIYGLQETGTLSISNTFGIIMYVVVLLISVVIFVITLLMSIGKLSQTSMIIFFIFNLLLFIFFIFEFSVKVAYLNGESGKAMSYFLFVSPVFTGIFLGIATLLNSVVLFNSKKI